VKGIAACGGMPMYLLTRNPNVKTLKDFSDKDKIAVPTGKISSQATILQMAAEQVFGPSGRDKLDTITIQLGHPDATMAMLSSAHEVNSHFSPPLYQNIELKDSRVHKVLNSLDVFGGRVNNAIVFSTEKSRQANPNTLPVVLASLQEAMRLIKTDQKTAIETYLARVKEQVSAEELLAILNQPGVIFDVAPVGMFKLATFMVKTGTIKTQPKTWKDLFFAEAHELLGD
jgi:NitT/TauT family transport system substrate-binding protein